MLKNLICRGLRIMSKNVKGIWALNEEAIRRGGGRNNDNLRPSDNCDVIIYHVFDSCSSLFTCILWLHASLYNMRVIVRIPYNSVCWYECNRLGWLTSIG